MPRSKDVVYDAPLTNFIRAYKFETAEFVEDIVAPHKQAKVKSGKFGKLGMELSDIHVSDVAADTAPTNQVDFDVSSTSFYCDDKRLKVFIPQGAIEERGYVDCSQEAAIILKYMLKLRREKRVADLAAAEATYVTTPTNDWDHDDATIAKDVIAGKLAFKARAGVEPNAWIIPDHVADEIAVQQDIYANMLSAAGMAKSGYDFLTTVSGRTLPRVMFGMTVYIAGAMYNTANPGATRTLGRVWGDDSYLFRVDAAARSTTWAVQPTKLDMTIVKWWENDPEGWWIKVIAKYDLQKSAAEAIHKFIDVT